MSRYYDPEIGRWLNSDDIGFLNPIKLNGLNLYAYCFNNPIYYIDKIGNKPEVNVGVDIWSLYSYKNYIWRGRYQPKRTFKTGENSFQYLGNNLLYSIEKFLQRFELNIGGYGFAVLNFSSSSGTVFSAGFDLFDLRMYSNDEEYLGVNIGSLKLEVINYNFSENKFTLVDAQATALTVGAYTEYVDAELLIGSVGGTIKWDNGKLTIGFSLVFGFKITIRFW